MPNYFPEINPATGEFLSPLVQDAIDARAAAAGSVGHNHDDRYYTETETDALLAGKAAVADGITPAERTKLAGVTAGAEVNVNADWNAATGDAQILNKPALGTAAAAAVGDFASAAQGAKADSASQPGHTHTAAAITDLTETVQDIVGALLVAGVNTTITYDDTAGTVTINSTASGGGGGETDPEIVRDVIGGALVAGAGIQITVNDAADTITVTSTAVQPTRAITAGAGLTGGGDLSADRSLAVDFGQVATAAQGAKAENAVRYDTATQGLTTTQQQNIRVNAGIAAEETAGRVLESAAGGAVTWAAANAVVARALGWIIVTDPTYGAIGNGIADDTSAIKAAIDAACGGPAGAAPSPIRNPTRAVYFPAGTFRITSDINVVSALGLNIHGAGRRTTTILLDGAFTNGFNFVGTPDLVFSDMLIKGNAGTTVTGSVVALDFTPTQSAAWGSGGLVERIYIGGAMSFRHGISFGLNSANHDLSGCTARNCFVYGNYVLDQADQTYWQAAYRSGAATGNVLNHTWDHCEGSYMRYLIDVANVNSTWVIAASGSFFQEAFHTSGASRLTVLGGRIEGSGRLLGTDSPDVLSQAVTLQGLVWNVGLNRPDRAFIRWVGGGTLNIDNLAIVPDAHGTPFNITATTTTSLGHELALTMTNVTGNHTDIGQLVTPGTARVRAVVKNFQVVGAAGGLNGNYWSQTLLNGGALATTEDNLPPAATAGRPVIASPGSTMYDSTLGKPVWAKTAGVRQVERVTWTNAATSAGTATITINGVATNVTIAAGDSTTAIATKFSPLGYSGWSQSRNGNILTFTKTTPTANVPFTYSAGGTGAAATVTPVTAGVAQVWVDATGATA